MHRSTPATIDRQRGGGPVATVEQLCGAMFWSDGEVRPLRDPEDDERRFEALIAIDGIPARLWERKRSARRIEIRVAPVGRL